ncbi:MFS general substrate transporter [Hysterangium stoloniferum]|nr:MFS general substrate transporter [Hysterangium stoloniferum]
MGPMAKINSSKAASPAPSDEKANLTQSKSDKWVASVAEGGNAGQRPKLPLAWRLCIIGLTCLCSFGNHWSNGLIVSLKTTIISHMHINNSQFATLVAVTNLVNTCLSILLGLAIDKWGGPSLSVILAAFHFAGAAVMAGSATNSFNSFPLLVVGKVIAAVGDGSLDNAQHRIFSTYFAPGRGFAFSIGMIWSVANLGQFVGQSTANIITRNLGSFAWSLWISTVISLFSLICALGLVVLDKFLRTRYHITDQTNGERHQGKVQRNVFNLSAICRLSGTFWIIVAFAVFENAGVQSFVSISTQFSQQRLKKGAIVGGWVSSFYLLLPVGLTPFLGIWIDAFGHRVSFLFISALLFLTSMLLLKFSHTVPTFVAAYVFYALAQCVTPAPQVEIVRNVIPDPQYFATAFAIKKSVVQASIVIITTAAGKIQDNSHGSLNNAITLWLAYAFVCTAISGFLLLASTSWWPLLPAARLAQVNPRQVPREIAKLDGLGALSEATSNDDDASQSLKVRAYNLKVLDGRRAWLSWVMFGVSVGVVLVAWAIFGLGVAWGVHGSVIAGTIGE